MKRYLIGILFILLAVVLVGCDALGGGEADVNATGTASANAAADAQAGATATLVAQQTRDVQISQTAEAIQVLSATATAYAPVFTQLSNFGFSPEDGTPGWLHRPIELSVEGFQQIAFENDFAQLPLTDFVVSADITMNTDTGLAGCGFIIRSDGNEEEPNQYVTLISRGGNGSIAFIRQVLGDFQDVQVPTVSAIDPAFNPGNDATNELTIVAQGDQITFYTNGTQVAMFSATEFSMGAVAMVAVSESGQTRCQFEDLWLFIIGDPPEIPPGAEGVPPADGQAPAGPPPIEGQLPDGLELPDDLGDLEGQLPDDLPLDFPTPTPRS